MTRREKIEERLRVEPDDVFLNYSYAMELAKAEEVDAARQAFEKVRKIDPNYVPAYFQEGQMLAQFDRIEEARSILQQGIQIARKNSDQHALGEMSEFLASLA